MEKRASDTDVEDITPEKKRPREKNNFITAFHEEQMLQIESAFESAEIDDPILILYWNPVWLAIAGNVAGTCFLFQFLIVDIVTSFCS